MPAQLAVHIVSAEREIFSGTVSMLFAPAALGEVGIAPGHAPLLSPLTPGDIRIQLDNGQEQVFYVSGGILEVQPDVVTVLSDTAVRAEDIDEEAVEKARQAAERQLRDKTAHIDYAKTLAEHAELVAQLRAIRHQRKR